MIAGTFRPRWKKGLRGPQPMCCQHVVYVYIYNIYLSTPTWKSVDHHEKDPPGKKQIRHLASFWRLRCDNLNIII